MERGVDCFLKIYTLGGLLLEHSGVPLEGFVSRKAEALLVYLSSQPRRHSREMLANLFWDQSNTEQSLRNLRVVLSSLQKQLAPYLLVTRQTIGIRPEAGIWQDSRVLEQEINLLRAYAEEPHPPPHILERLNCILPLYQGDFLVGVNLRECQQFNDWVLLEQQRLRNLMADVLYRFTEWAILRCDFTAGIHQASRLLTIDPLWEKAHQQLIRLLAYSGRRAAALDQYHAYAKLLADELDIQPEAKTTQLYEDIRAGEIKTLTVPSCPD